MALFLLYCVCSGKRVWFLYGKGFLDHRQSYKNVREVVSMTGGTKCVFLFLYIIAGLGFLDCREVDDNLLEFLVCAQAS